MDARIFLQLTDAIATATNAADLAATAELVRATTMDGLERRALERAVRMREDALRLDGDVLVARPMPAPRGD